MYLHNLHNVINTSLYAKFMNVNTFPRENYMALLKRIGILAKLRNLSKRQRFSIDSENFSLMQSFHKKLVYDKVALS